MQNNTVSVNHYICIRLGRLLLTHFSAASCLLLGLSLSITRLKQSRRTRTLLEHVIWPGYYRYIHHTLTLTTVVIVYPVPTFGRLQKNEKSAKSPSLHLSVLDVDTKLKLQVSVLSSFFFSIFFSATSPIYSWWHLTSFQGFLGLGAENFWE